MAALPRDRTVRLLVAILLLLVVVRVAIAYDLRAGWLTTGQPTYDRVARHVEAGDGFTFNGRTPSAETPPVYPVVLAATWAVGGRHWWGLAALQTLFDLATAVLLFALGRRLFGVAAGLLAAAAFAVYPYLASQSAQLMDTSLFTLGLVAFLYTVVRLAERRQVLDAALVGAVGGLAFLVRPTIAVVALFLPALLALLGVGRRELWRSTAVAFAAAVVVLMPWTVRNAVAFHTFVPGAAKGGTNFWVGNSPHAAEYIAAGRSVDLLLVRPDAPKPPRSLNPAKRDTWYLHRGLAWVRAHPGAWLHTLRVKLVAYWSWNLNPKTIGTTRAKEAVYTASYAPLLVLAALSLILLTLRQFRRELLFVLLTVVTFSAANILIVGYSRVRAPIDPLLMVLAGAFVVRVALALRRPSPLARAGASS